ncbi:MAG: hypothetical protein E7291_03580 [Lachnospiraceae bacterium]|nr:hypothetical protein [Lachnospiraceae bacterium]
MNQFKDWWKEDKRYLTMLKAVLLALLPILCCLISCGMQGKSIGEVYLPVSEWNDELFYFKQVESIVNFGYPQGFYGFNESHALKLSFAAWSPVLVFPWILWGLLFGWNLMSPIICNILLLTVAVFAFVWLVKPTWKQLGVLTLLFCLYTPFVRYMLSGMPEIICFSMLIVFYGLAINYLESEKGYKLALLFAIAGLLVLMRPYMLLFLLLPVYLWVKKSKWKGLIGSVAVLGVVLGMYAMIKHYLAAEYFAPLFFTDWITTFFTEGFGAGIHNFFGTLYYMGKDFLRHMRQAIEFGRASGAYFWGYLVMLGILVWQSVADWRKVRRDKLQAEKQADNASQGGSVGIKTRLVVEAHLAFCFVGMLFALLLMYKLTEGSKHLLTFMGVGVFVISLMRTRFYKKAVLLGAVFAFFYTYMAVDPYDYQVPFANEEKVTQVEYWSEAFDAHLELVDENVPNFDNVIIWVFSDMVSEESVTAKWQILYGLPKGFGISCCMPDYIVENLENLQSRYIATVAEGTIDGMCAELGYREIARDADMVVYERY